MYTAEGFLIAADGRSRMDGQILSDTNQKIFPINQTDRSLAYAFSGSIRMTDIEDSSIIHFDFHKEAEKVIASLEMSRFNDLESYAKKIGRRLYDALEKVNSVGRIRLIRRPTDHSAIVACLFIVGYYSGKPSGMVTEFPVQQEVLSRPTIRPIELSPGYDPPVMSGSAKIADLIFDTDDPMFARYRVPRIHIPGAVTISEVSEVARNYILACTDPTALSIDEEYCLQIGGHTHMAKITPFSGFEWVEPPVTAQPS